MIIRSIRPVSAAALCWAAALWPLVVDNAGFWRTLCGGRDLSSSRSVLAVVAIAAVLWVLFSLILRMLCWRWVGKPLLATVLLETDWREATDLSLASLWLDFAWRGLRGRRPTGPNSTCGRCGTHPSPISTYPPRRRRFGTSTPHS